MMFNEFITKLTNLNEGAEIEILGDKKRVMALAEYSSENLAPNNYLKASFSDGSFVFIIPNDEIIFYAAENIKHITEIPDEDIGKAQLTYAGKTYSLANQNDYQYVEHWYFGSHQTLEGECRFSDYAPLDGSPIALSLGWLARDGSRADIFAEEIPLNQVII